MKIAIITGASSGMGAEFAKQIDSKCLGLDEIWLLSRREKKLEEIAMTLHTKTRVFQVDLTDIDSLHQFANVLKNENPSVRILVNCAGIGKIGLFDEVGEEENLNMVNLNVKGLTQMTQLVIPYMPKRSFLIQLSSAAAFLPQPGFSVYAATKSYVFSLSRALARELKERKIFVTIVCPGPVDTEFFDHASPTQTVYGPKKYFMVRKDKVVKKALKDAFAKKEISIYGLPMKALFVLSKVVNHKIILKFMDLF